MNKKLNSLIDRGVVTLDRIKVDSREVNPGDVFVAVRGTKIDGHNYVQEALGKGAAYVVCEESRSGSYTDLDGRIIFTVDTMGLLGGMLSRLDDGLFDKLSLYGVTGTNGKTTTAFMIKNILKASDVNSGLLSTVFINTDGEEYIKAKMTTPDILSVYRYLSMMKENGKDAAVIEVSSHALNQKRISGVKFDSAVFTNITPEHLDYHKNMEAYLEDKLNVFQYLKPSGISVVNIDDVVLEEVFEKRALQNPITFSMDKDAEITASVIDVCSTGTRLKIKIKGQFEIDDVFLKLPGKHNIYNVLAAIAALSRRGLTAENIRNGIESFKSVPGRLDQVETNADFKIFVDYAHTPNALENILRSTRTFCAGNLICVFGCGGDRDKSKRPEMGRIAEELSDYVILTNDNSRTEDPVDIINQIEKGIRGNNNYCIIADRYKAILEAVKKAKAKDVVLIAGKGHEDYQIIGKEIFSFNDKIAAGKALSEIGL